MHLSCCGCSRGRSRGHARRQLSWLADIHSSFGCRTSHDFNADGSASRMAVFFCNKEARRERQMRGDLSSRPPRPALPALAPQIALGRYPAASFLSTCLETRTSPCICIGTRAAAAEGAGPRGCKDARARGHGALAWLVIPQPWVPKRCPQRPYPASTSTLIVKWGTSWNNVSGTGMKKNPVQRFKL